MIPSLSTIDVPLVVFSPNTIGVVSEPTYLFNLYGTYPSVKSDTNKMVSFLLNVEITLSSAFTIDIVPIFAPNFSISPVKNLELTWYVVGSTKIYFVVI